MSSSSLETTPARSKSLASEPKTTLMTPMISSTTTAPIRSRCSGMPRSRAGSRLASRRNRPQCSWPPMARRLPAGPAPSRRTRSSSWLENQPPADLLIIGGRARPDAHNVGPCLFSSDVSAAQSQMPSASGETSPFVSTSRLPEGLVKMPAATSVTSKRSLPTPVAGTASAVSCTM
jgi:hypothetical protein